MSSVNFLIGLQNRYINPNEIIQRKKHPSFGSSQVNIVAMSDNHGKVDSLPAFYQVIKENKSEIFPKNKEKSTLNMLVSAGDFFINPLKQGLKTPLANNVGDVQEWFFRVFVDKIRSTVGGACKFNPNAKNTANFEAVYTPGNHCFDGGDEWLMNKLLNPSTRAEVNTVLTNVDLDKSKLYQKLTPEQKEQINNYKVFEVVDDKDPSKKNHVLMLGITISGVDFYTPNLVNGLEIIDRTDKKDVYTKEEDLKNTFNLLNGLVKEFKQKNPNGAVILSAHTGNRISEMFAKNVKGLNIIFNGHDHKDQELKIGNTHIISLGSDNKLAASIKLKFNDDGKLQGFDKEKLGNNLFKKYYSKDVKVSPKNSIKKMLQALYREDFAPVVKFQNSDIKELPFSEEIRFKNSLLANYVTDSVFDVLKTDYKDLDAVGLPSSSFRNGLKDGSTNIDLLNMLSGAIEATAEMKVGTVKGKTLAGLVFENIQYNFDSPTRNTIIQWSGIKINKNMLKKSLPQENEKLNGEAFLKALKSNPEILKAIQIKQNGKYSPLKANKQYQIALPPKLLDKNDVHYPSQIRDNFNPTGKTMDNLFRTAHKEGFDIKISEKTKEQRIIGE